MITQILLPNCSGKIDFVGDPIKSLGYYATNRKLQTIGIHTTNFVGRIWVYGSLKEKPNKDIDSDWFVIPLTENTPYKEYNNYHDVKVNRTNDFVNIIGNYSWLKAKMDRSSYIEFPNQSRPPYDYTPTYVITAGANIQPHEASLNFKTDPSYYDSVDFKPNYKSAYEKTAMTTKVGNVEKIFLCY